MKEIFYLIFSLFAAYFIYEHLIPYIFTKYYLWKASRTIDKIAKRNEGEVRKKLEEISSDIKQLNKQTRL